MTDCPTVLVSMPFMDLDRPSIQLGLLKAIGTAHGFTVDTLHANLDLAARIGAERYGRLAEHRGRLLGDWLFSVAAFGAEAPDPDGRLPTAFAADLAHLDLSPQELRRLRDEEIPAYLDGLLDAYDWGRVRVVGFSSTYQQNTASFALARLLKQRHPGLLTVFGGANFDGDMGRELVRTVGCIDVAVIGEADLAFPRLLAAVAAGTDPGAVPGVARRVDATVQAAAPTPPLAHLDETPVPDYDEYFQRARALGLRTPSGQRHVWLPIESSRGCWWGAKHHCTFCGLNATTMQYRAKSAARVATELASQAQRYGSFRFQAVDNILDPGHFTRLLPELIAAGTEYEIFYEVKANLTRDQLRLLAQAGVTHLQPGLESLSTPVLDRMRKGVRAIQNINLLRWARYYGIEVAWNILYGFPGDTEAEYLDQAALIPHLLHLRPPASTVRIWLERFSPLYVDGPAAGITQRRPEPSYTYVYPTTVDLDRVAYFFDYEVDGPLPTAAYDLLGKAADEWRTAWRDAVPPALTYRAVPGFVQIHDSRRPGESGTYTVSGPSAAIYLACSERPRTAAGVKAATGLDLPVERIAAICRDFRNHGLMVVDGDRALSLALPAVRGR